VSYLKLFKTCSDHAVGVQSVNQALSNNIAMFDQFGFRHAVGNNPNDVFMAPGRHDDPLIARTVLDYTIVPGPSSTSIAFALVSGPLVVNPAIMLATGQWKVPIATPTIFGAVATIKGASIGAPRAAMALVYSDASGHFALVSTWNVNGGVLAAYDFSLVIWSEGIA
jgi:hypothetical protein